MKRRFIKNRRAVDKFFEPFDREHKGLSYDDVRAEPGYSEFDPDKFSTISLIAVGVQVGIPLASAAMDTVTRKDMAIGMAMNGGIGFVDRNLTPEEQLKEVKAVKFYLSRKIETPITVTGNMTLQEVIDLNRRFQTFPVINSEKKLLGLVTKSEFEWHEEHPERRISQIMTPFKKLITANPGTSIDQAYDIMIREKIKVLPLIKKDGALDGMFLFNDALRNKSKKKSSLFNTDASGRLVVGAAVGVGEDAFTRVALLHKYADVIAIDTAHGDTKDMRDTLTKLKREYNIKIVVGNISTGEAAYRLVSWGADGIKVGQGPGSICTTRRVAGIGVPQVTAIHLAAKAIEGSGIPIIADGGIEWPGDIVVAIIAGAHCVMMGGLLAGTDESPGEKILRHGRWVKMYRGMGSLEAMKVNLGSRARYRQQEGYTLIPEGESGFRPYVGDLKTIIEQHVGGLRAGMGYTGLPTIPDLRKKESCGSLPKVGNGNQAFVG